ncbi:MAG: hypothetical protein QOG87_908 [Actinomycetota bacterium]|jgi:hypothetical protein
MTATENLSRVELPATEWLLGRLDVPVVGLIHHGSTALGLGNERSDIDILALSHAAGRRPLQVVGWERSVHVDYRRPSDLDPEQLSELLLSRMFDTNSIVTRISTGIVVFDTDGVAAALVGRFRDWRLPELVAKKLVLEVLGFLNDVSGALGDDETETADVLLRLVAHSLAKAALIDAGVHVVAPKWQYRLLERHAPVAARGFLEVAGLGAAPSALTARYAAARAWLREIRDRFALRAATGDLA